MILLKNVSKEERPLFGQMINILKSTAETLFQEAIERLVKKEEGERLQNEMLDITLPGRRRFLGSAHLLTKVMNELLEISSSMGFSIQLGPEIDSDYYNFAALNFQDDHPARDMQDTFYLAPNVLLRTHTSNIQVHVMQKAKPPIRIVAPGRVYRNEEVSARSHVFFHQIEGLYIDRDVSFSHLFHLIEEFLGRFFKRQVKTRFRPSYFPFVEPGLEADVECLVCQGSGCSLCKHTGWLEILGAGMVHPEVLNNVGIDPEEYRGFAWGLGVERLVMLKYQIPDIRFFTENDYRFLTQFSSL
jgi:phenylalanyl-tRNA synthetase alpha chain